MVGGGVFDKQATCRTEKSVMPHGVRWIRGAVATFEPDRNQVTLEDGTTIGYDYLVVAPSIATIGRASRRERVCQCVLISVVAVSFKKTTQPATARHELSRPGCLRPNTLVATMIYHRSH